jgi:hypothetical protein
MWFWNKNRKHGAEYCVASQGLIHVVPSSFICGVPSKNVM